MLHLDAVNEHGRISIAHQRGIALPDIQKAHLELPFRRSRTLRRPRLFRALPEHIAGHEHQQAQNGQNDRPARHSAAGRAAMFHGVFLQNSGLFSFILS